MGRVEKSIRIVTRGLVRFAIEYCWLEIHPNLLLSRIVRLLATNMGRVGLYELANMQVLASINIFKCEVGLMSFNWHYNYYT